MDSSSFASSTFSGDIRPANGTHAGRTGAEPLGTGVRFRLPVS
jgi:hypothetical protein